MSNEKSILNNQKLSLTKTEAKEDKKIDSLIQNLERQISLKKENDLIVVTLPPQNQGDANEWNHIIEQFQSWVNGIEKDWLPNTKVNLLVKKRLLDSQQLQTIANLLQEINLKLSLIITSRRQTAVVAASAGYSVKQESDAQPLIKKTDTKKQWLADPLYVKNTIRSGVEIRHNGTVIILGDVNPGATIIARGDIFVWGNLRGIAHAGANGNRKSLIMALKMNPTQLRIGDLVATSPDNLPPDFDPEVAYISEQGIKITSAFNFSKTNFFCEEVESWTDANNKGLI